MSDQLSNTNPQDQIDQIFGSKVAPLGDLEAFEETLLIKSSSTLHELADSLFEALNMQFMGVEFPFTMDDLRAYVNYLVEARTAFVFGIRGDLHPKEIAYPAMFGPILAAIGTYRDDKANVTLKPAPADLVTSSEEGYVAKKNARTTPPGCYDKVVKAMRTLGVPMTYGLPFDKETISADFFRIEIADNMLRGTQGEAPSPHVLFARAMVEMTYLESLFGSARVSYAGLSSMKQGINALVMSNIEGMRFRT